MRRIIGCLMACSIWLPLALSAQEPPEVTRLQKGMPPAVAELIARIVDCNHWQGEEPYNAARASEIAHAIAGSRCASLEADEAAALASFGQVAGVRKAVAAAKEIYL